MTTARDRDRDGDGDGEGDGELAGCRVKGLQRPVAVVPAKNYNAHTHICICV